MFVDHFSAVAKGYATYRPHYPAALVDVLADRAPATALAWDAGCGNGQLSGGLARRFAKVIATDPSQAQLDAATREPNIEYRCEPSERSSLEPASADLVVAAQAAHWFDWPAWLAEVARVAKPGALVCVISYGNVLGELVAPYRAAVEPYWPKGREHVDNGYRDLVFPWPAVETPPLELAETWTRDELFGYVTTWSATERMVKAVGTGALDQFRERLAAEWPDNEPRDVRWPLTIKLARVG